MVLTSVQHERRASIVAAALDLAADGYDAVQIRTVAERAGIAASTFYEYFSSKDDLLLSCLHYWLGEYAAVATAVPDGATVPYQRLLPLIRDVTESLCVMPHLAAAFARAYLCAHGAAAENAALVRHALSQLFTDAIDATPQTWHHKQVGELLVDVWAANILAVVHNRVSVDGLLHRLECAVATISRNELRVSAGVSARRPDVKTQHGRR